MNPYVYNIYIYIIIFEDDMRYTRDLYFLGNKIYTGYKKTLWRSVGCEGDGVGTVVKSETCIGVACAEIFFGARGIYYKKNIYI